jgi:hypothetical protein
MLLLRYCAVCCPPEVLLLLPCPALDGLPECWGPPVHTCPYMGPQMLTYKGRVADSWVPLLPNTGVYHAPASQGPPD